MKKIGIVTITSGEKNEEYNYGNKLQNYALQKYLESKKCTCLTIVHNSIIPEYTKEFFASIPKEKKDFFQIIDDIIRVCCRKLYKNKLQSLKDIRIKKFKKFNKKYLNLTDIEYTNTSDLSIIEKECDYFVAGSDQIWNPYFEGANDFYYLDFTTEKKKVAYAASFGVSSFPNNYFENKENLFKGFRFISVREEIGKKVLAERMKVKADLVCDPVFLLEKDSWDNIANNSDFRCKKRYLATYILGKKNIKTKRMINEIAEKMNLEIVDIYSKDDRNSFFAGPEDFIKIIKNSELLITDSFHGMAFSVIYDKQVVIIDRNTNKKSNYKMNSRIENLANLVGIELDNIMINNIVQNPSLISKSVMNKIKLEKLILDSKKFLNESLNISDGEV